MNSTTAVFELTIPLPAHYRSADMLSFHGRDKEALAESTQGNLLRKGLLVNGRATVFEAELHAGFAQCRFLTDGPMAWHANAERIGRRVLGLSIDGTAFELAMRDHVLLSPLVRVQAGLLIPQVATPFEALTWAITGQQINLAVAIALRRRLIALAGQRHSSGLWCYPDADSLSRLSAAQLGEAKFSRAKAQTLLLVSEKMCNGELALDDWLDDGASVDMVREQLLAIPGIGPWTANYTLLRGFGFADCSLHGDAAVKNALQALLGQDTKVSNGQAEAWLAAFSPWRSLVAAHLWASRQRPV